MHWFLHRASELPTQRLLQAPGPTQVLLSSAFSIVQLSNPYMITGKTIALTRWAFVGKVMSLLYYREYGINTCASPTWVRLK